MPCYRMLRRKHRPRIVLIAAASFLRDLRCLTLHLCFCLLAARAVEHQYLRQAAQVRERLNELHGLPAVGAKGRSGRVGRHAAEIALVSAGTLILAPGRRDVHSSASPKAARFSSISLGIRPRLALRRHPVASRRKVRAQDELALKTARLETAVRLGDLVEGDPLGDARPNGASRQ
jgi:hypothetical protein